MVAALRPPAGSSVSIINTTCGTFFRLFVCPRWLSMRTRSRREERQQSRATAALIPGALLRTVPGGQWLFQDPRAKLDAIREFLGVERPVIESDRILATVLITDIVDSTKKAAELGDNAWRGLLAIHDERAKSEIARHRGTYVHGTGDGFIATFDGPARAVRCAHAFIAALAPLGLEIRAGCHTGEIERSDGDVRGLAVHISARVAAMARPSEIWASSTVRDLTAGSDLIFEDAGEHELKGVPNRWRLYRVR
jgi:class 3 adenylate cyclase